MPKKKLNFKLRTGDGPCLPIYIAYDMKNGPT